MNKFNRFIIILSSVMFVLLMSNLLMLINIKISIETGLKIYEWMGTAIAGILIAAILSHILGLSNLFAQLKVAKHENIMRAAVFVTGIFSLFLLFVDIIMLRDIGNEYLTGHNIYGEWRIVFVGHCIHVLFFSLITIQCIFANKNYEKNKLVPAIRDEVLFLTVHQIGIISAIFGFVCLLLLYRFRISQTYQRVCFSYYVLLF